jgi:inner membrane protein YidH
MADADSATDQSRFEVRVTADSHFGWLRTRLSVERTMMAWVRIAVSLIGFGFGIEQFFERLQQAPGTQPAMLPEAPKYLGVALICCGIMALVISIWQYRWTARYLSSGPFAAVAGLKEGECSLRLSRLLFC